MPSPTLLAVPLLMLLAGVVERRRGAALAGAVTSLPVVVVAGVLIVADRSGLPAAAALTGSLGSHVVVQVVTGLALLAAGRRLPPAGGLAAAGATYALGSVVVAVVPAVVACVAGVVALAAGRWWVGRRATSRSDGGAPPGPGTLALRAAVALLAATVLVVTAAAVGPQVAGAIGAFPALTMTLALMVWRRRGPEGLHEVVGGLVRALPAYLAFCVVFTVGAATTSLAGALTSAIATAIAVLVWVLPGNSTAAEGEGFEPPRTGWVPS